MKDGTTVSMNTPASGASTPSAPSTPNPSTSNAASASSGEEKTIPPSPAAAPVSILDPNHWSKDEKYDVELLLEPPYKKHLGRHANK